jgi:hypothetical protein
MKFPYVTAGPAQSELDSLPRLPLTLHYGQRQITEAGLVDSGATVNVLPYSLGVRLGAAWDNHSATIRLAGNLGNYLAMPLVVTAEVGGFTPVKLAFAWTQAENVSLILGQMNFFMEFDVCFFRSRLEFDVNPKAPRGAI